MLTVESAIQHAESRTESIHGMAIAYLRSVGKGAFRLPT